MAVLAIDAGTTGVTTFVVDEAGEVRGRGYQEFPQRFPRPGWVEHDPDDWWSATLAATQDALGKAGVAASSLAAIGITNQLETTVVWDRQTLRPVYPAIVWQDRRTAPLCEELRAEGWENRIAERTGLVIDPYFSGTKLAWLLEHVDGVRADAEAGRLAIPRALLPEVRSSSGSFGVTDPDSFLGAAVPVAGVAGDQQAALIGQACFEPGDAKNTYGTGSFVLLNTGRQAPRAEGLLTTVAYSDMDGVRYALEGSIFVTGAAIQWLRDGLGLLGSAAEAGPQAASVPDTGGVYFVPALVGLGAPWWDPYARGIIVGITRGTTRAHLVRAAVEAIAYQTRDVVDVMAGAASPTSLRVDGGASAMDLLCQFQADLLGVPVRRPVVQETTAMGAAFLAGLGARVWFSREEAAGAWALDREFVPGDRDEADRRYAGWQRAVERARGWEV